MDLGLAGLVAECERVDLCALAQLVDEQVATQLVAVAAYRFEGMDLDRRELLSNLVYSCLGRTLRMILYSFAILEFHSLDHIGQ